MENQIQPLITEEEIKKLIFNFVKTVKRNKVFSQEDILKIVKWAEDIRLNNGLLELALDNFIFLGLKDGEVVFTPDEDKMNLK